MKLKNVKAPEVAKDSAKLTPIGAVKYIIGYSSVVFTALALLILIVQALQAGESEVAFVKPLRFLLIYPFTLFTAAAGLVFKVKDLGWGAKFMIHYAVSAVALYIFVCAPAKEASNPWAMVALASFLYWVVALTIIIVKSTIERKKRDSAPYDPVYKKGIRKQ